MYAPVAVRNHSIIFFIRNEKIELFKVEWANDFLIVKKLWLMFTNVASTDAGGCCFVSANSLPSEAQTDKVK